MRDVLYLAWRYLAYHRFKAGLLVAAIALVLYLPIGLNISGTARKPAVDRAGRLDGPRCWGQGKRIGIGLAEFVFSIRRSIGPAFFSRAACFVHGICRCDSNPRESTAPTNNPIVGTSIEYFSFRDLRPAVGRLPAQLGDCVLGARAAARTEAEVGGQVMSSPESVFDIKGVYPLKMNVVGILEPTGTPDDDAVFVDVKTTWVIAGVGHGHEQPPTAAGNSSPSKPLA